MLMTGSTFAVTVYAFSHSTRWRSHVNGSHKAPQKHYPTQNQ
ncbi:hypothetical protein UUU_17160 [Klebsiella pneumoniae subsp. pneumoniae DSM 30104 = JCM 1662 = NBRC 14940]|nr:hypothetical protein UUU_17160 [Klebsiella pneumoniae subsp. pneumoniae DSM 30104 = JCM 1662 = NBRC 14940]